jgi:hypothetical protein
MAPRGTGVLAERAAYAASCVGWTIRTKTRRRGDGDDEAPALHHTRSRASALQPLLSARLTVHADYPHPSAQCVHRNVMIRGHGHKLVFGGFTGLYEAPGAENPTTEAQPLTMYTDGGWVDAAGQALAEDDGVDPVKPVAAYGICVVEDVFEARWADVVTEDAMEPGNRATQAADLCLTMHGAPLSGHHSARAYAAEVMAILEAMAAPPVDWHTRILSDSEAALSKIDEYRRCSPARRSGRDQCHALLRCICWIIETKQRRGATVTLDKVRGHDAAATEHAVGNRLADLAVNRVMQAQRVAYDTVYTDDANAVDGRVLQWADARWAAAAHRHVFMQHIQHRHVIMDGIRDEIKRRERVDLMRDWGRSRTQSRYLVPTLVTQMKKQLHRFRNNPTVCSFLVLAFTNSVEWSSMADQIDTDDRDVLDRDEPGPESTECLRCTTCDEALTLDHVMNSCSNHQQIELRRKFITDMRDLVGEEGTESATTQISEDIASLFRLPDEWSQEMKMMLVLGVWNTSKSSIASFAQQRTASAQESSSKQTEWSKQFATQAYDLFYKSSTICCCSGPILMPGH